MSGVIPTLMLPKANRGCRKLVGDDIRILHTNLREGFAKRKASE